MPMNDSQPSVLLLGDYSNCHATLASGLAAQGCRVTVASDGSRWMDCPRDVDISRRHGGKLGGLLHYLNMRRLLASDLSGFDIVAVYDPVFAMLRPERLRPLFGRLRRNNHRVFLTAMSTDLAFLDMLEAPGTPLRYSEWFVEGKPNRYLLANRPRWDNWHSAAMRCWQEEFFDKIDGAVSVLYEYHLGMERRLGASRCAYGGIPVDCRRFAPSGQVRPDETVRFFLGRDRTRKLMKGSDLLEEAARNVVRRNPGLASLEIVENVPFAQFIKNLEEADVVLDQIYSYTPATTALMAMAMGTATVSGGEEDFYNFIGEYENRPVVNAPLTVAELENTLEGLLQQSHTLAERGRASRRFVLKHNEAGVVARRFLDFWLSKC